MEFIALQTLDGRITFANPTMIVSIAEPREDQHRVMTPRVQCVVSYVDGKFTTVVETCDSVRRRIEAARK